jgi:hypothetical protein
LKGRHWRPLPILLFAVHMRHTGRLNSYICGIHSQEVPSPMAAAPAMIHKTFFLMGEKPPDHNNKPYNTVPSNPTDSWPFCTPTTTTSTLVPSNLSSYPRLRNPHC